MGGGEWRWGLGRGAVLPAGKCREINETIKLTADLEARLYFYYKQIKEKNLLLEVSKA